MKLILFCSLLFAASVVYADSANVTWTPPTQRTDGTPLPQNEIGNYILRINGTVVTDTIPGTETTYRVDNLTPGNYSFDMATKDTVGRIGPFSVAVQKSVNAGPGAVESIDVQIVP